MFIIPAVYYAELTSSSVADTGDSSVTRQLLCLPYQRSSFLQFVSHPLQTPPVMSLEESDASQNVSTFVLFLCHSVFST